MFSFRRTLAEGRSRIRALCERFSAQLRDDSEARGLKLLREWLSPEQLAQFNANGYFDVIGSDTGKQYRIHYGSSMNSSLPVSHLGWIETLPLKILDEKRLFVHAGIRPGISTANQSANDLLWIREPFLSSEIPHELFVVHGHTPDQVQAT
jgi:hypothetical protein